MNAFQEGPWGTWQVTGPGQRTIAYVAGQSYPDTSPGAAGPPLTHAWKSAATGGQSRAGTRAGCDRPERGVGPVRGL